MKNYLPTTIIMAITMIVGCTNFKEREAPVTSSEVLNEMVRSASYQYINVNDAKLNEITLSEEDIIYQLNHNLMKDEPMLGHLTNFAYHDGRFYVYDSEVNAIFKIDKNGAVQGPFSREGRGPGEHGLLNNLKINHQFVWAADVVNARINRYTHEMAVFDSFDDISSFLDLNDELIITENSKSRGIAPVNPGQGRIGVHALNSFNDTITTILPRIIPEGYEPQLYNSPRASINRSNVIVAAYQFLPWFFLFDQEFTHLSTLIIEHSKYDEMDIPPMEIFRHLDNQGFGGTNPITEFKLMDNNEIFFSVRRELIHLKPSADGTYQFSDRYKFYHSEQEQPLWISDIFLADNGQEHYLGSWYHLFRFAVIE